MKLQTTELDLRIRQLIVMELIRYNVHISTPEMNATLVDAFPHLFLEHRPSAQATLHALKRRGYAFQDLRGDWRLRPLGKRVLETMVAWLVGDDIVAESPPPVATAMAVGDNVVPLRKK